MICTNCGAIYTGDRLCIICLHEFPEHKDYIVSKDLLTAHREEELEIIKEVIPDEIIPNNNDEYISEISVGIKDQELENINKKEVIVKEEGTKLYNLTLKDVALVISLIINILMFIITALVIQWR